MDTFTVQTEIPMGAAFLKETYRIESKRQRAVRTIRCSGRTYSSSICLLPGAPEDDPHSVYDWCWLRQARPALPRRPKSTVRIADLFAGCGQMSLGVVEAARAFGMSAEVALAADVDPAAIMMCKRLFPDAHLVDQRLENVLKGKPGSEVSEEEKEIFRQVGKVDILVGGPPCQGHSNLNNRSRRRDKRNSLGFRMVRAAELLRPRHVLIENVPGIRHDRGRVLYRISEGLEELGYHVQVGVMHAEAVGVAQRRHRAFVIATRSRRGALPQFLSTTKVARPRTFQWACGDLCNAQIDFMSKHPSPKPQNQRRISYLFANDLYDLPLSERPLCHQGGTKYYSSYGRIRPDVPCQTITTNFRTIGTGRFVHPFFPRPLTLREAARIQYIPDFVDFAGMTTTTAARLIGNAVPPKLSYALALRLLACDLS